MSQTNFSSTKNWGQNKITNYLKVITWMNGLITTAIKWTALKNFKPVILLHSYRLVVGNSKFSTKLYRTSFLHLDGYYDIFSDYGNSTLDI
jgi:hypothetical protein